MKKAAIIISSLILLITIGLTVQIIYNLTHQKSTTADITTRVNVLLTRPQNWQRIVDKPVITQADMDIVDGSTATIPITAEIFRQFWNMSDSDINQNRVAMHSTTHEAYKKLIHIGKRFEYDESGKTAVDLIFVTPPSDEEKQEAQSAGVTLDMTPIAKDGFVFITHKDNPVDNLTVAQIQDIYSGKITNWKEVGGEDIAIKPFQREKNSGSQTAMEQMVMQGKTMLKPIDAKVYFGMGGLVDAVAEYKNGKASIGYTYYYYINNLYKNDNIKVLKVDGISAENANLTSGRYPFTTAYYAVMRGGQDKNSPAVRLRDFLLTEKGQRLIEMAGYCRGVTKSGKG